MERLARAGTRTLAFAASDPGMGVLLYCACFAALGLCLSTLGPVLLDLSIQTGSTLQHAGYCFGIRSFGYALGSTGGPLYDFLPGHNVLGAAMLVAALGTLCIPFVKTVVALGAVVFLQGIGMGFCDTGGNVMTIMWWGAEVGPYLQSLHFAFALGATAGPLLLRIVEVPVKDSAGVSLLGQGSYNAAFYIVAAINAGIGIALFTRPSPKLRPSLPSAPQPAAAATTGGGGLADKEERGNEAAMWTNAEVGAGAPTAPAPAHTAPHPSLAKDIWLCVFLIALLLFMYVGAETGYGAFLTSYAVLGLRTSEAEGQLLTGAYWGAITAGRFASIFTASMIAPGPLLSVAIAGSLASSILLLIFASSVPAVWFFTIVFGASMACVFPTTIALAESYFPVQGKHATCFVIGGAAGEMLIPFIIATLFGGGVDASGATVAAEGPSVGPVIMLWMVAGTCVAQMGAFQLMLWYGTGLKKRMDSARLGTGGGEGAADAEGGLAPAPQFSGSEGLVAAGVASPTPSAAAAAVAAAAAEPEAIALEATPTDAEEVVSWT